MTPNTPRAPSLVPKVSISSSLARGTKHEARGVSDLTDKTIEFAKIADYGMERAADLLEFIWKIPFFLLGALTYGQIKREINFRREDKHGKKHI